MKFLRDTCQLEGINSYRSSPQGLVSRGPIVARKNTTKHREPYHSPTDKKLPEEGVWVTVPNAGEYAETSVLGTIRYPRI